MWDPYVGAWFSMRSKESFWWDGGGSAFSSSGNQSRDVEPVWVTARRAVRPPLHANINTPRAYAIACLSRPVFHCILLNRTPTSSRLDAYFTLQLSRGSLSA